MNKKRSNVVKKWAKFQTKAQKLNAQKSILSGRFGALAGRLGDLMKNMETPGKTRRVGRYASENVTATIFPNHCTRPQRGSLRNEGKSNSIAVLGRPQ